MIKAITNTAGSINFTNRARLKIPVLGNNYALTSPVQRDVFIRSQKASLIPKKNDISFGYNFELKNVKGVPCAYCGKGVLSKEDVSEIQTLRGQDLVERLEYYASQGQGIMPEQQKTALALIEMCALVCFDKNAQELLPVVYTTARKKMLASQNLIYSRIDDYAHQLHSQKLINYIDTVKKQDVVLNPEISVEELSDFLTDKINVQFRKDVVNNISNISNEEKTSKDGYIWNKIIQLIHELPSSKNDPNAYLVKFISKALRKDSKIENQLIPLSSDASALFYSTLLLPFAASAEHIKAFSDDGPSNYSNYLVTHTHCNGDRGNAPWAEYMLEDPKKFDYIVDNLTKISTDEHIEKSLKEIRIPSYIRQVTRQLTHMSEGHENNPEIKRFLSQLSEIKNSSVPKPVKKIQKSDELVFPDNGTKQAVLIKLNSVLSIQDSNERGIKLERALNEAFESLKKDRITRYKYLLKDLSSEPQAARLKKYFANLRDSDQILQMFEPDCTKLKMLMSENYCDNYKFKIANDLGALRNNLTNKKLLEIIDTAPRKFVPLRKPEGYYLKILLDARVDKNTYDIEMLKKIADSKKKLR